MKKVLMKCGHTANAQTANGTSACVICNCLEVAKKQPSLRKRKAKCCWCGKEMRSSYSLPFFEYRPNEKYDSYYCGCGGGGTNDLSV